MQLLADRLNQPANPISHLERDRNYLVTRLRGRHLKHWAFGRIDDERLEPRPQVVPGAKRNDT